MKKDGYVEADAPNPQSVYAKTKTAGEIAARENPNHYVIRLSRLFGKPAASVNAKKSFVDVMLALTEKHSSIDVVDGEFSSPTYAPDLARATYDMVKLQSPFGTYHRTNDGACTWFAFAQEIFRIAGKTVTVKPVPPEKFVRPAAVQCTPNSCRRSSHPSERGKLHWPSTLGFPDRPLVRLPALGVG